MMALGAVRPAQAGRGKDRLRDVLQDGRQAAREIVVQQHQAGIEIGHADPITVADERLELQMRRGAAFKRRRRGQVRPQAADTHLEAGLRHQAGERAQAVQIVGVAGMAFGNDQDPAGAGATALDGLAHGLDTQRMAVRRQIVEAGRKQVGVDGRKLEAGIAQIDRGIERRPGVLPLTPKPVFDRALLGEQRGLQPLDRTVNLAIEQWQRGRFGAGHGGSCGEPVWGS